MPTFRSALLPAVFVIIVFAGCIISVVESFRQPNIILCPDQNWCQDTSTCCEVPQFKNSYGCCALPNAVCCKHERASNTYCCPSGWHCVDWPPYCVANHSESTPLRIKRETIDEGADVEVTALSIMPALVKEHSNKAKKVIGNTTFTCELDLSGVCEDGEQCCYNQGSGGNSSGNGTTTFAGCCPTDATCCNDASTGDYYGYCPTTNAVCCSNKQTCCPQGYQCSTSGSFCTQNSKTTDELSSEARLVELPKELDQIKKIRPAKLVEALSPSSFEVERDGGNGTKIDFGLDWWSLFSKQGKDGDEAQPCDSNPKVYCADNYTCCQGKDNSMMCCPMSEAVCCGDNETCCPHGTTCDITNHICTK